MFEVKKIHLNKKLIIFISLLSLLLTGCDPNDHLRHMLNRLAPDDDEALAKECLMALRTRDLDTVIHQLDARILFKKGFKSDLTLIADTLAQVDPLSEELVGCYIFSETDKRQTHLTYQYHLTDSWLLANIRIETTGQFKRVLALNVNPIPKSLGELNAFTLEDKSFSHYMILLITIIIPIFILIVLITCIRTKMKRRKWLWIIFILLGFGKLSMNWTTGQILFNPLSFYVQLFSVAVMKHGLYAPWIFSISIPLGAIIFLLRRKALTAVEPPSTEQGNVQPISLTDVPDESSQSSDFYSSAP